MVNYYISKIGAEIKPLLKMNFQSSNSHVFKNIPQFYHDIFISFNKCKSLKPFTQLKVHEIMTQVVFSSIKQFISLKTLKALYIYSSMPGVNLQSYTAWRQFF